MGILDDLKKKGTAAAQGVLGASVFDKLNQRVSKANPFGSFDINRFRATLTGTTNTNAFLMMFTAPEIFNIPGLNFGPFNASDVIGKDLSFLCYSSSIPSKQVTTVEYRTNGPFRKMPNGYMVDDLNLQFYARAGMLERFLFEAWIDIMTGNFKPQFLLERNSRYNMEYYDKIHSNLILQKYSPMGKLEYIYRFKEAYPVALQEVPVSWENENEIVKFNVTFAFHDWEGYPVPDVETAKSTVQNSIKDSLNSVKTLVRG